MAEKSVFNTLNAIDVSKHLDKKRTSDGNLSYLSWPWAWKEVKSRYPDAHYEIKRYENNLPYVFDDATGYMVSTSVTIEGITHEMWLPVMDGANRAMRNKPYEITFKSGKKITVQPATMFDINKTIMRCLVKNLAMFGLGLYIYAGEDLPSDEEDKSAQKKSQKSQSKPKKAPEPVQRETPEDAMVETESFTGTFSELKENVRSLYKEAETGVDVTDWLIQTKLVGCTSVDRWIGARQWILDTYFKQKPSEEKK